MLRLTADDRVLVVAPHPDDESIACGGLLLAARDLGASRGVVVLTDGENNPWPQRWLEKRWRIDAAARARWGARRRAEAGEALDALGVSPAQRHFLRLPDGGLTDLLMRDAAGFVTLLSEHIARFRPTLIALPTLEDRHPDHSAAHLAVRLALDAGEAAPRLLVYAVHGRRDDDAGRIDLTLDAPQQAAKRAAIACHRTQMALSRRRFLAFASERESYREPGVALAPADGPLRASVRDGFVHVEFAAAPHRSLDRVLLLARMADGGIVAERIPLPAAAQRPLRIPLAATPRDVWIKLVPTRAGLFIYDRCGWQRIQEPPAGAT